MAKVKKDNVSPVMDLPDYDDGWTLVLFGTSTDDDGEPQFTAADGDIKVPGCFFVPIPTDLETAQEAVDGYSTHFTGTDGERVTLKGATALAARKWRDGYETVRNDLRENGDMSPEALQRALLDHTPFSGKRGAKTVEVSMDEIKDKIADETDPEVIAELMAELIEIKGGKVA